MTVEILMKNLGITEDEARQLIADDAEIDKMTATADINADLSPEQKQNVKKITKNGTRKGTNAGKTREKDPEKVEIIKFLYDFIADSADFCEIVNAQREISFNFGENSYSIQLIKHRKDK